MDDPEPFGDRDDPELQLLSREELKERVREQTASLQNLMDTMVDVLLKLDPDGRIARANAAVEEVLGYDEDAVVGKPVDVLFASPDDNERLSDMMTKEELTERLLVEGQLKDVEVYFETADGEAVPMSLSASMMTDDEGSVSGIVCVAKDISERKEAERRAEFLHSLLRHDLGNRLQITQGYLEALKDRVSESARSLVDEALYGVDGAVELVENVRALHRLDGDEQLEVVDVRSTVEDVVRQYDDLRRQEGVTVDLDVEDPPPVMGGNLLPELFANLVENALVHSGGDRVRITTQSDEETVTVVVEDDGTGVPDDKKDEILERGVKGEDSDGTGLGMHLAARIADLQGRGLTVRDSELGGARFDVVLERAD